jgi:hypothetical protein
MNGVFPSEILNESMEGTLFPVNNIIVAGG